MIATAYRAALPAVVMLVASAALSAQQAPSTDTTDRVRAALEKPPSKLTLAERTPDFSVHIEKRRPMQDIFDKPPWQLPPIGWQPPGVGFDLLSIAKYVAKGVADAKRGHDERLAREEVQRSILDYCAAQPDGGASTQMCSTSPAIR